MYTGLQHKLIKVNWAEVVRWDHKENIYALLSCGPWMSSNGSKVRWEALRTNEETWEIEYCLSYSHLWAVVFTRSHVPIRICSSQWHVRSHWNLENWEPKLTFHVLKSAFLDSSWLWQKDGLTQARSPAIPYLLPGTELLLLGWWGTPPSCDIHWPALQSSANPKVATSQRGCNPLWWIHPWGSPQSLFALSLQKWKASGNTHHSMV